MPDARPRAASERASGAGVAGVAAHPNWMRLVLEDLCRPPAAGWCACVSQVRGARAGARSATALATCARAARRLPAVGRTATLLSALLRYVGPLVASVALLLTSLAAPRGARARSAPLLQVRWMCSVRDFALRPFSAAPLAPFASQ